MPVYKLKHQHKVLIISRKNNLSRLNKLKKQRYYVCFAKVLVTYVILKIFSTTFVQP